ncbi:hypothetical protein IJG14_07590 [bacterium]|nr:hypothetical protein [bacterium]
MDFNNEEILALESSLKNYFLREKARHIKNDANLNYKLMKYRGLSLTLDDSNPRNILFVVGIATFEASFDTKTGLRVSGSLAGDERIVYQWFVFGGNQQVIAEIIDNRKKNKKKIQYERKTMQIDADNDKQNFSKNNNSSL